MNLIKNIQCFKPVGVQAVSGQGPRVGVLGVEAVFLFGLFNQLPLLLHVHLLDHLLLLVVEDDQVAVADIETGQMVTGVLGVENVLVDDKGRSARLWRRSAVKGNKKHTHWSIQSVLDSDSQF